MWGSRSLDFELFCLEQPGRILLSCLHNCFVYLIPLLALGTMARIRFEGYREEGDVVISPYTLSFAVVYVQPKPLKILSKTGLFVAECQWLI